MGHWRATEAALRWSAMTEHTPGVPLGAWLADLPDERLIRLLELRPDLAQPPPGSIAALAARAQARQSVKAATDDLDFLRLAVLDALLVLHADTAAVPLAKLVALIGDRAPEAAVLGRPRRSSGPRPGLGRRRRCASSPRPRRRCRGTRARSPSRTPPRTAADIAAQLDALDEPQRELLDRLLEGSPVGRTRDAAPGTPPDRPVPATAGRGAAAPGRRRDGDPAAPGRPGAARRGARPGAADRARPAAADQTMRAADVDAAAAGAVIDLLREFDVGRRNTGRRTGSRAAQRRPRRPRSQAADQADRHRRAAARPDPRDRLRGRADRQRHARSRTARTVPGRTGRRRWPPTGSSRRRPPSAGICWPAPGWTCRPGPALIGSRGPDGKPYAALSDSLYSTAAPLDRRLLLAMLADLPPGTGHRRGRRVAGADLATAALVGAAAARAGRPSARRGARARPRRPRRDQHTAPRALLDRRRRTRRVAAMAKALPAPIDHFLVQADLTVVVPGPLHRDLADELAAVATVESAGAAMVYRVSEQSIRHALDTGRTRGRAARVLRTPLQNACAAGADLSDRRRRAPARPAAGRHGGVVRPLRGSRAAGPGDRRARRPSGSSCGCWRRRSRCRRRRSPTCSPRCAPRASPRPPRTPPARSSTSAPAAPGCPTPQHRRLFRPRPARPTGTPSARSSRCCARWSAAPVGSGRVDPAAAR